MNFNKPVTRRESIKKLLQLGGSLGLTGAICGSLQTPIVANAATENKKNEPEGKTSGHLAGVRTPGGSRCAHQSAGGQTPFTEQADSRNEKLDRSSRRQQIFFASGHPSEYRRSGKLFSAHGNPDRCRPDNDQKRAFRREYILCD